MKKRPIRVLFDSEIFGLQLHGGISRYFAALLEHLPRHGVSPTLWAPFTYNQHLRTGRTSGFVGLRLPLALRSDRMARLEQRGLRAADRVAARLGRFDIVHGTYYQRRLTTDAPKVVTVYDMAPERFPELFPAGNPHAGKREACAAAALIIAISERTKRDLLELFPELDRPVEVIHLAVDTVSFRSLGSGGEDGTILYVGQRHGYKNFGTFAEATARLLAERPELSALCVGGGPLHPDELAPFVERGCADRVAQRTVSDRELPALYGRATAFVYPSLYEGFGLPVLEAFAARCPVVLSNASCLPEVAADAAEYFDPHDVEALLEALRRVTDDRARREELRRSGDRRLGAFSWDLTAERTAAAYRRLLDVTP